MAARYVGVMLVAVLLVTGGCNKQESPGAAADLGKVFSQVDACMGTGDTNGALVVLSKAMEDKTYVRERGWLFGSILNILLMGDRVDEAKARYLGVIGKDEELTRIGFGTMYGYYQSKGDNAVLEAWVKQMMEAPLPKDMLAQAYAWQMGIFRSKGQLDKVIELIPVCLKKFDMGMNCGILGDLVAGEISAGQYDNAGKLLDAIEKEAGSSPELKDLVAIDRGDILFLRGNWKEAEPHFSQAATGLQDGSLAGWFPRVVGFCVGKQQYDLADRLCDYVLKSQKGKENARRVAAEQWIGVARVRKDAAAIPVRLEALRAAELPPPLLFSLYRNEFYTVLAEGKKGDIVAMIAFGDKLETLLPKKEDKAYYQTLALDGSFVIEDYARSLKILEAGIPEHDKKWHEMAINKAKAHLALKDGRYKEAVECFRKFMVTVEAWEKPQQDPITGILCSKEMCLGRNAKRIGDIWTTAGDQKAAADAYAEAKADYEKALADVKADSQEAEVIRAELAEIGKPPSQKSP